MRTAAAACLGAGLLFTSLATPVAALSEPAGASSPAPCSALRIPANDPRRSQAGAPPWAFVISCEQADGAQTWYATEPVAANGVCSYQYRSTAPGQPTPYSLVPPGTIFSRAAIVGAGACPGPSSAAYANLWKVDLDTFKAIASLDYQPQFQAQHLDPNDRAIERISLVSTNLLDDQYQIHFRTREGTLYSADVYRWPLGIYSIASFGKIIP